MTCTPCRAWLEAAGRVSVRDVEASMCVGAQNRGRSASLLVLPTQPCIWTSAVLRGLSRPRFLATGSRDAHGLSTCWWSAR